MRSILKRVLLVFIIIMTTFTMLSGCSGGGSGTVHNPAVTPSGFSSNLPIVVIDTKGTAINDKELKAADMKIINNGYERRNFLADRPELTSRIGIKIRGQSSKDFPKKQYKIETWDENNQDQDVSLLDLPKDSDWVLYGPYADKSLIRNYLVYELGRKIMYAPRTRFVEVFLRQWGQGEISDADYLGVYLIIENIKRGKSRVDVEELETTDNAEPEISGGYIFSTDKIQNGDIYFKSVRGQKFTYVYPKGDEITTAQKTWLQDYVNTFETALYGESFSVPEIGYEKYIDIDSFIDCIIINEMFKNVDGFIYSTYFYKDRNKKLAAGPLWDFNLSAGNVDYNNCFDPSGWYTVRKHWNGRLTQDPKFAAKLNERWKELRQGLLSTENINDIMNYAVDQLSEAQERNAQRWNIYGRGYIWPNPRPDTQNYMEEIERMKNFLASRALWIDHNIGKLK